MPRDTSHGYSVSCSMLCPAGECAGQSFCEKPVLVPRGLHSESKFLFCLTKPVPSLEIQENFLKKLIWIYENPLACLRSKTVFTRIPCADPRFPLCQVMPAL